MLKPLYPIAFLTLAGFAACGPAPSQSEPKTQTRQISQPVLKTVSNADFATTNARLKAAIETRGLTLFNTIDHAAGAARVGETLAPNTLYIFGNPKAGTPLMKTNPAMGLHLPLKAQVYEANGKVYVSVSNIRAITRAAGVNELSPVIENISKALKAIKSEATGG